MDGENEVNQIAEEIALGSPPQMQGKVARERQGELALRIIPADAEKMHLSLALAHDTLHALTQFFNRVAFVDKLQNRSE